MKPDHLFPTLSPLFFVSTLFGTGPFYTTKTNGKYKLKIPKLFRLITIFYIAIYTYSMIYSILNVNNKSSILLYGTNLSRLGLMLEIIGQIVLIYAVYITSFITPKHNKNILNKLAKVDTVLHDLGHKSAYSQIFWKQIVLFLSGISWILLTIFMQKFVSSKSSLFNLEGALNFVYYFPVLVAFIVECQFCVLAVLVYQRFKAINTILREISDDTDFKILDHYLKDTLPKVHNVKNVITLRKVEILMEVHDTLVDAADILNSNYSIQLLLCFGVLFLKSIFAIFFTYYEEFILKTIAMAANWAIWILIDWAEILLVSITCHAATDEAKKIGVEIHKLLINTHDDIIHEKLIIFSQQVFHRPVKFSAYGLFTIDASLIFTIVGSTTTYLLIMLQFEENREANCIISNGTVI